MPTVSVVTEEFVDMANSVGRSLKYPQLPILVVPHPFETLPQERIREIADEKFEDIVTMLTRQGDSVSPDS